MVDFARRVANAVTQRQLFDKGAQVLVAVSGGPDSCALLLSLVEASERGWLSRPVGAAHFHHGLRGADADGDAGFVAGLCARLHVPCVIGLGRVPGLGGHYSSATARAHRYAFLTEAAHHFDADTLATAHNQGDQAETVLWRVLRGTGLDGLGGIPARRLLPDTDPPLHLVRPLLDISRSDIEAYCQFHRLATRYDPSNGEEHFARVRMRRVLPELAQEFNPRLAEALARLADHAQTDNDLLQTLATDLWYRSVLEGENLEGVRLVAATLQNAHPALRQRVLLRAIRRAFVPGTGTVEEAATGANVARLDALLTRETGRADLPGRLRAALRDGILHLCVLPPRQPLSEEEPEAVPLSVPGQVHVASAHLTVTAQEQGGALSPINVRRSLMIDMALPSEGAHFPLAVRLARTGDRIAPLGMGGRTRLVRSILSEAKVPLEARAQAAVVVRADTDEILWLIGHVQANATRVTPDTGRRVRLQAVYSNLIAT